MPDKSTPPVIEHDPSIDGAVLGLLMLETSYGPWAVEELAREIGGDITDSLNRLYGGGLIHRIDRFVWASHAAAVAAEVA